MINFDFWHGETIKEVKKVTCYFNDLACYYWGHLYNSKNEIIGDYNTADSVELEKMFPGIFGA
jgi:iron-sulfur cluster repair protein YtfE (RIC family)